MKFTAQESRLLRTLASIGAKCGGSSAKPSARAMAGPVKAHKKARQLVRASRTREQSAKLKERILAAVKKGTPVATVADRYGVTSPYVYQLIAKSRKAA